MGGDITGAVGEVMICQEVVVGKGLVGVRDDGTRDVDSGSAGGSVVASFVLVGTLGVDCTDGVVANEGVSVCLLWLSHAVSLKTRKSRARTVDPFPFISGLQSSNPL
jgi:hypothetical protein